MQATDKGQSPSPSQDQQKQNLRYVGLIINSIIHSFNNSIGLIQGYANLSLRAAEPDSRIHNYAQSIMDGAKSVQELSNKMQILSGQENQNYQSIPIQSVVEEAMKSLPMSLTSPTKIQSDLDSSCGDVLADADQIKQVVINLCSNAYDAVQDNNGSIKVSLKEVDVKDSSDDGPQNISEGKYVKLTVSDTGVGMDQEVSERIFEPFFTTKKEGENAGLGLAVVHGIIKQHEGEIITVSKQGEGATFDVYLPLANKNDKKIAS